MQKVEVETVRENFSRFQPSFLRLENGAVYPGMSPKWQKDTFYGEVVFTTGMTGYPETLTDPSYSGQIIVFTYPLIGNYGAPPKERWESENIYAKGVVISELCENHSHYEAISSLEAWLESKGIPLITGVDTRSLTKSLRSSGTMLGAISNSTEEEPSFWDPNQEHLVSRVGCKEVKSYPNGNKVIIAVDCGMKENIVRNLTSFPITLKRVPYNYDYSEEAFDGIFLSNGPGDPTQCTDTVNILKKAMLKEKPIFGICLGTQLMALAAGAKTYKLPFGHRGQNQPCMEVESKNCFITSQNHGYAVDGDSLPDEWKVTFTNLNDGSVEGIAHKTKPFAAVQFHPEATPGPTDTLWLFNQFYQQL